MNVATSSSERHTSCTLTSHQVRFASKPLDRGTPLKGCAPAANIAVSNSSLTVVETRNRKTLDFILGVNPAVDMLGTVPKKDKKLVLCTPGEEFEAPRILRQSAHEGCMVVSCTHQPHLSARKVRGTHFS